MRTSKSPAGGRATWPPAANVLGRVHAFNERNDAMEETPGRPDRRNLVSRAALLRRVSAEFEEMPCLRLTTPQAQRLLGVRRDICERLLATLTGDGSLTCGSDGRYRLADGRLASVEHGPFALHHPTD